MTQQKHLTLPILGMTCANCVATVERNLKKVDGVESANVNLSSERAAVSYDPQKATLGDFINRVERAGYEIAVGEAHLSIQNLTDSSDALRLEKTLNAVEGVIEASVSYGAGKAAVKYVPTMISQNDLRSTIRKAGFETQNESGQIEDAEAKARKKEIAEQRRLLILGLIFSVPSLFFPWGAIWDGCRQPLHRPPGWTISSGRWPRRCSFMSAGSTMPTASSPFETDQPTWMSWWPLALQLPISIPSQLPLVGYPGMSILKPQP